MVLRHHRQHRRRLVHVDLGLGRVGEVVERHEELAREQASAPELRAQR